VRRRLGRPGGRYLGRLGRPGGRYLGRLGRPGGRYLGRLGRPGGRYLGRLGRPGGRYFSPKPDASTLDWGKTSAMRDILPRGGDWLRVVGKSGGVGVMVAALAGCGGSGSHHPPPAATGTQTRASKPAIKLSSPAFAPAGRIPRAYTCNGHDISPPLRWTGVPAGTRELALEMIDIDAPGGRFVHWALARIPPRTTGLIADDPVPAGAVAARNDFGRVGYGGPCPPAGKPHRYVITVLALRAPSGLRPGFSAGALATSRALARGQLTGTYGR
jgi:Raf kinase inhibitor-like YbhB/YbcL family protein